MKRAHALAQGDLKSEEIPAAVDSRRQPEMMQRWLLRAENLEHVSEVVELLSAGRGGAADRVEHLAVLDAVIGDALDAAALVEIDRDDALVGGGCGAPSGICSSAPSARMQPRWKFCVKQPPSTP